MTRSILLVTEDLDGVVKNSGIGTYYREIAYLLKDQGYDVSILVERVLFKHNIELYYTSRDIPVYFVNDLCNNNDLTQYHSVHWAIRRSHRVNDAIEKLMVDHNFDIIEFPDWGGLSIIPIRMKKYCGKYTNSTLLVKLHGYLDWHNEGMGKLHTTDSLTLSWIEKYCILNADRVISPSKHLIHYTGLHMDRIDIDYVPNPIQLTDNAYVYNNQQEIVFFGRLEERKGVYEFINAIKLSNIDINTPITFVGMSASISRNAIKSLLIDYDVSFFTGDTRDDAIEYILNNAKLVVIPSKLDNFPNTVIECISHKIPFITSDVGGIPEILGSYNELVSTPLSILHTLIDKSYNYTTNQWIHITEGLLTNLSILTNPSNIIGYYDELVCTDLIKQVYKKPVTLLMPYRNGSEFIKETLDSLNNQTYTNFKLLIVDDSDVSESEYLIDLIVNGGYKFEVECIKGSHISVGHALNQGVQLIDTDYFIQVDGDNLMECDMIETYVNGMLHNDVSVLTCYNVSFGSYYWVNLPIGPINETLPINNTCGDACAIYRTNVVKKIGFPEDKGIIVDWAMWNKLHFNGFKIDVVPKFLFKYRALLNSHSRNITPYTMLRENVKYVNNTSPYLYDLLYNGSSDYGLKDVKDFIDKHLFIQRVMRFVFYNIIKRVV